MKKITFPIVMLLAAVFCTSCKKDTVTTNTVYYVVPSTYSFANVNDSNQVKLLIMADQIVAKVNVANAVNTPVSAQTLKDMFNNVGGYFVDTNHVLNGSGLRLADYC